MPSASALALALALALTILVVQPPQAAASRRQPRVADDDNDASDDGDDDDSTNSSGNSTVAARTPPATVAKVEAKLPPASLLHKDVSNASASDVADDGSDSDDDNDDKDDGEAEPVNNAVVERLKAQEKAERADVAKVEEELDVNLVQQTQAKAKLADINDPRVEGASDKEIDLAAKAINNETQSEALGTVLGKMWKEMRMYAGPFYEEHLEKELTKLSADKGALENKEKSLRATLKGTRKELETALESGHADDEKQEKGDKQEEKEEEVKATKATEQDEAGKDQPAAKKPAAPEEGSEEGSNRQMWLALWFVGVLGLVGGAYFAARR